MDENTFKLLSLVLSVVSTLGLAYIAYLGQVANKNVLQSAGIATAQQRQTTAAVKAVEATLVGNATETKAAVTTVAETLVQANNAANQKLAEIDGTTRATHILVNSAHGAALLAALDARKTVRMLTKNPQDIPEADKRVKEAQRMYDDHMRQQAVVDQTVVTPPMQSKVEEMKRE